MILSDFIVVTWILSNQKQLFQYIFQAKMIRKNL